MNNYSQISDTLHNAIASVKAYNNRCTYSGNYAGNAPVVALTTGPTTYSDEPANVKPSRVLHNPSIQDLLTMCA